jgi:hypothetical protein
MAASNFYASNLGYKLAHNPQALTTEEQEKVRRYVNSHSEMTNLSSIDAGCERKMQADQPTLNQAFISDFGHFFCRDLAKDKINVSFCPTSDLPKAPQ